MDPFVGDLQMRAARKQSFFREVNERIASMLDPLQQEDPTTEQTWVCECCVGSCTEWLSLSLKEYERVRSDGTWFLIAPAHHDPLIERVLERTDRYWLVEKIEKAAEVARSVDPREAKAPTRKDPPAA